MQTLKFAFRNPKLWLNRTKKAYEPATDRERREIFLRYVIRGWLMFGIITLAALPFFPQYRSEFIFLIALTFPTYLLIRFVNLAGRTRLAGVILTFVVNFGFYGIFLLFVKELGAEKAFATESTVWMLMGLAVLFAGAFVDKWVAPMVALINTILVVATRLTLAPTAAPRPSVVVFWCFLALLVWLYEGTINRAMKRVLIELEERKLALDRQEAIFEGSRDSIFISDSNSRFIEVNSAACELTGYSREQLLTMKIPDLHDRPDLTAYQAYSQRILDGEDIISEAKIHRRDGSKVDAEFNNRRVSIAGVYYMHTTARNISERKLTEEALRKSEERMRAIVEGTPHLFFYTQDAEANTTYVSPTVEQITGYKADVWLKRKDWFITDGTVNQSVKEKTRAHLLGEFNEDATLIEVRHANGNPILLEAYEYPVVQNGKIIGLQGVAHDITEREHYEEALRESETRFRQLTEAAVEGIAFTEKGIFVDGNERLAAMLGYELGEMIGRPVADFIAPESLSLVLGHIVENYEGQYENLLVRKDGSTFPVESHARMMRWRGTNTRVTSLLDISDRKRTEEQLHKLSLAVEQSPASIVITDTDGNIEYVNPKFTQVTGYTAEEAIGKNPRFLKSGETPPEEYKKLWETIRAGRVWRGEFHNKKKNGELYWEHSTISPVKNADNTFSNFVEVKEDITARKHTEEALRQAQKLEGIGTLAGGIAHDFNNLLNAILGQSSLAMGKLPKESPARDHIEKSLRAAERAADLTRHLLAYSGKGKIISEKIDLNRLVKENIQMLEVSVPKTVMLHYVLTPLDLYLHGDIGQIQQVIMNLIINAGEAISPNPGSIIVRTGQIQLTENDTEYWKYTNTPLHDGNYVSLKVKDSGHGMAADVLVRIFDPFFTTKFTGRGLGLAAVLGIIRGHKGGVRIESEAGKGTEFEVVFPLVEASPVRNEAEKKAEGVINGGGRTILAIDDEPSVLELLDDVFTDANFKVLQTLNPMEGIRLYRKHQQEISMVILDYSMPGMDGKETFEKLVKINKNVKVILCSGYSEEEMKSAFGEVHPLDFIKKPYKPSELLERVSSLLLA